MFLIETYTALVIPAASTLGVFLGALVWYKVLRPKCRQGDPQAAYSEVIRKFLGRHKDDGGMRA